ncbi:MAG: two-component system response regulator [Thaumarchaeota archaeon]|nr:MAG: two-component system response regulator [Nitrososphaerota archaeon]
MNPLRFAKILIVDDSVFFRSSIKKILSEAQIGSKYFEAKDGKEAISIYIANKPTLVIMDIVMPNVDGVKAIQAIMKYNPNAKILVVSSKENKEIVNDAIKAGAKDYVLKPFDSGQVVMAVSKQLVPGRSNRIK